MALRQLEQGRAAVENQYSRVVNREGNVAAQRLVGQVFERCDRKWRGIGAIPQSGYRLRAEFRDYDAERLFNIAEIDTKESANCISGLVLKEESKSPMTALHSAKNARRTIPWARRWFRRRAPARHITPTDVTSQTRRRRRPNRRRRCSRDPTGLVGLVSAPNHRAQGNRSGTRQRRPAHPSAPGIADPPRLSECVRRLCP